MSNSASLPQWSSSAAMCSSSWFSCSCGHFALILWSSQQPCCPWAATGWPVLNLAAYFHSVVFLIFGCVGHAFASEHSHNIYGYCLQRYCQLGYDRRLFCPVVDLFWDEVALRRDSCWADALGNSYQWEGAAGIGCGSYNFHCKQ